MLKFVQCGFRNSSHHYSSSVVILNRMRLRLLTKKSQDLRPSEMNWSGASRFSECFSISGLPSALTFPSCLKHTFFVELVVNLYSQGPVCLNGLLFN